MKRKRSYVFFISAVIIVVAISWYVTPKKIDTSLYGIEYRLGEENETNVEHVTIALKGNIQNRFFRERSFRGTIKINDYLLPPAESADEVLEIRFGALWNGGLIGYNAAGVGTDTGYGLLMADTNFSRLTIVKVEPAGAPSKGWTSEDGTMISAPATNRSEALQISNDFIRDFLQEPLK